ncbi:MAG: hypothetical protein JXJ19_04370 [Elusimicrobia bacterium]|nr:hypothetical protein [Elusimicrobiota bacterium]
MKKKGLLFILIISLAYWGYYFFKPAARVNPGVRISDETAAREAGLRLLRMSIEVFMETEKRYPYELEELVEKNYLARLPESPADGWEYDPESGAVR